MKIDIFSGFLGSGKTTLIKKLIKEAYAGEKVVLIENEFGEIGIDGGFLQDAGINITEMNSGCICCSLVGDFAKALQKVTAEYHPDRIIIEPSGVGKLSDVVRAVEKGLDGIKINSKTTIINAKKCKMYAKNFGEFFMDQLENADCVVLSHTDVTTEEKVKECVEFVKAHNPDAVIVATHIDSLDGKTILEAMEKKSSSVKDMEEELVREHKHHHHDHDDDDEECSCGCGHHHHDHDDDDDEHEHEHHHHDHDDDDEECSCGCGHHDDDDDEDDDEHEHHHHHDHDDDDEECSCGCGHHHHHGHDADEVFVSWGKETTNVYGVEELKNILSSFDDGAEYGLVLRAKGIVAGEGGKWIHFDYVPEGVDVRYGSPSIIGKLCVIGSKLDEEKLGKLFRI